MCRTARSRSRIQSISISSDRAGKTGSRATTRTCDDRCMIRCSTPLLLLVACAPAHGAPASTRTIKVGQGPCAVAMGDFNGDGKADLAVANSRGGDLTVLVG